LDTKDTDMKTNLPENGSTTTENITDPEHENEAARRIIKQMMCAGDAELFVFRGEKLEFTTLSPVGFNCRPGASFEEIMPSQRITYATRGEDTVHICGTAKRVIYFPIGETFIVFALPERKGAGGKIADRSLTNSEWLTSRMLDPLGSMFVSIDNLADTPELRGSPELSDHASAISRGIHRLLRVSDNLQVLLNSVMRPPRLAETLPKDFYDFLRHFTVESAPYLEDCGASITLECGQGEAITEINETLMRRVLFNLISNSIKFSKTKRCEITIRAEQHDGGVRFMVIDHGMGMTAESMAHAFEPFSSDMDRVLTENGMGLGLAASAAIVRMHMGRIYCSETWGGGTTVSVILPGIPADKTLRSPVKQGFYANDMYDLLIELSDVLPRENF